MRNCSERVERGKREREREKEERGWQ